MPDQPTWYERVPSIVTHLSKDDQPPFLDRPAIEMLFGVRRRSAINLMHRFGGYQVGRTFLVNRRELVEGLADLGGGVEVAVKRKQRIIDSLGVARRELSGRKIKIPVSPAAGDLAGVTVESGQVRIRFVDALELLEKLLALAQAIGDDFEGFVQRLETCKSVKA